MDAVPVAYQQENVWYRPDVPELPPSEIGCDGQVPPVGRDVSLTVKKPII
jgi:hypothetical protein